MSENIKNTPQMWERVARADQDAEIISRPSLTYWQDAWRRLKKNYLSMAGLVVVILMALFAIVGPYMSDFSYSDQDLNMTNLPNKLDLFEISEDSLVYLHPEYSMYLVSPEGEIIEKLAPTKNDMMNRQRIYEIDGQEVVLDYSFAMKNANSEDPDYKKFEIRVGDRVLEEPTVNVRNKTYIFGTDSLGRDLFVRVAYGARISLAIALVATVVQFFIGVLYGGISGYAGGSVDNLMMRIVDIIATIPLLLYVILLMVLFEPGLKTIMIALGTVYWVRMARIVRGQVLSIKEQEFVLAARTIGASTWRIMVRHLIPNAMGPIIVSLAMMIPNAIFTEAFLSFIGLGVSAPMASWGTLADAAVKGLRSYPYQLFYPSLFISLTVLSFNFLGDGLRDALDPRLRK
jgi:oligopeptide transport system permease protein